MGCGCKGNRVIENVVNVQSQHYANTSLIDMKQENRGEINDNLCAVSLSELQDLMYKTKVVLDKEEHSEINKGYKVVQKWFENYGFECPDRKQFVDLQKLVENEYSKYNS
jgi:hypothetical protein|nr:MAG TPA: hypothetical protein [Caudoviricetes sp.]